ncbi:MAG: HEAT repeat domain-containing protein [Xenococcus sp. (in: cyanobacteria)]
MAGRCIAECKELSEPLIDETIDRIYQFWLKYPKFEFISSVVGAIAQTYGKIFQRLITALQDEDFFVRGYAVEALGNIGNERAADVLITIYRSDIFPLARNLAIRFSKPGLPFIPVYPELVGKAETSDGDRGEK